jgi:hypothetical protein
MRGTAGLRKETFKNVSANGRAFQLLPLTEIKPRLVEFIKKLCYILFLGNCFD